MSDQDPIDEFFAGHPDGRALFDAIADRVDVICRCELKVGKSQVAFVRRHPAVKR
jgi:hypothetical protein